MDGGGGEDQGGVRGEAEGGDEGGGSSHDQVLPAGRNARFGLNLLFGKLCCNLCICILHVFIHI